MLDDARGTLAITADFIQVDKNVHNQPGRMNQD